MKYKTVYLSYLLIPTSTQNSTTNSSSIINKLTELKHLSDNHLITQEDYDNKKGEILKDM